jgi:hypothetical protein
MSTPFVLFRRLEVRSMVGLPSSGLVLDDIDPGINIVFGPNASGKSRTARALELVLWPGDARKEKASLRGHLQLDAPWIRDVDAGAVSSQLDGRDAEFPTLPPPENARRYHLELQDLLQSSDSSFAETIAQESIGGYDLDGAKGALGFRNGAHRSRKETNDFGTACAKYENARHEHEALFERERKLDELHRALEDTRADQERARLLNLAIERAELIAPLEDARSALDSFPKGMDRIVGNEAKFLEKLQGDQRSLEGKRRDTDRDLERARKEVAGNSLSGTPMAAGAVPALRQHVQNLREAEQAIKSRKEELDEAVTSRDEARDRIGSALTTERLHALDLVGLEELSDFAHESERLHADRAAAEAILGWLGDARPVPDIDKVLEGVQLLRRWLSNAGATTSAMPPIWRWALTASAMVLVAAVIAAAAAWTWWLLFLAPVGIVPVVVAWRQTGKGPGGRSVYEREYVKLGLDNPERWDEVQVERRLRELQEREARSQVEAERGVRWDGEQGKLRQLDERATRLEQRRSEFIGRLGVAPDTDERTLYWLVSNVIRWERSATRAAVVRSALERVEKHRATALQALVDGMTPHGFDPGEDWHQASRTVEDLAGRGSELASATGVVARAEEALEELEERQQAVEDELGILFSGAGVPSNDAAVLVDHCNRLEDYRKARETEDNRRRELQRTEERLRAHSGFEEGVLALALDELRAVRADLSGAEQRAEDASKEIVRIETLIDRAKNALGVEEALAAKHDAQDELVRRRDEDRLAVAGGVLTSWLHEMSQDRDRPPVFHRARELLLNITRGRYRLDLEDGHPPRFRAFDTVREQGLELEHLSSGTRVQLLLAVRVAFVETQERGARPPLVLDETLANSDDSRARAIIEAAVELARTGRQVFYLTAQPDEVGKWQTVLEQAEMPYRVIDLQECLGLTGCEAAEDLPRVTVTTSEVPPPGSHSYEEYGQILGVEPIDPHSPVGAVHLWHLLDAAEQLHGLLLLGLHQWGPLRELLSTGGAVVLGDESRLEPRLDAAARAVQAVCEEWRVGRGRPIDRLVLEETGAVTAKPLPRIAALADDLGGDVKALLRRLETERVAGFGDKGKQRLRDALEEHGYFDPAAELTPEEIHVRVLATLFREVQDGLLAPAFIERTLGNLSVFETTDV